MSHSHSGMDMDMGGASCKISMLWNWYTIDACFLSSTWHIKNNGMFAASCIGVALLVVSLEFLRRLSKEYDSLLQGQFLRSVTSQTDRLRSLDGSNTSHTGPSIATFRASPLQQLIRAVLHALTFGVAYIIMLLAMYFNGYIIISIIIGAGLGKFLCDWMVVKIPVGGSPESSKVNGTVDEPTVCCG